MSNRYVYGVVSADEALAFETETVGDGGRVYPISYRRLAAIVSDIETTEPEETDEAATTHDDVLRELIERDGGRAVVPMQFGMVFERDRALKNVLRRARPVFRRSLRDVDGHVELGLKLVRDADADVDREAIETAAAETFDPLATQSAANDLFSDRLVLNRSYLVARKDQSTFDDAIAQFEDQHEDLHVRYTGPFAPYSFVDLQIGAQ